MPMLIDTSYARSKAVRQRLGAALPLAAALTAFWAPGTAEAQVQRSFINLGFEQSAIGCSSAFVPSGSIPGWETTHPIGASNCGFGSGPLMELWRSGYRGVPSRAGSQHAELNAYQNSRVYQSVCVLPNDQIDWRFSHRGYGGTSDVMEFQLGTTGNRVVRASTTPATMKEVSRAIPAPRRKSAHGAIIRAASPGLARPVSSSSALKPLAAPARAVATISTTSSSAFCRS